MHEFTDADLVALARSGDTEAFRVLIERYQFIAFSIAMHFASQSEVAQDLVQEAMLQAYLSLDQLREVIRFKNWFYGIVLNVFILFGISLTGKGQVWVTNVQLEGIESIPR